MPTKKSRIAFLDFLRPLAIFMVLLVHACEQYYFGADGGLYIASRSDAFWTVAIDSACRAAVPLFVMTSAYLLFPLRSDVETWPWLRHRLARVGIPFAIWCCVYNLRFGGGWTDMLFNFPMGTGGHLWFVPMLLGLYLLMPLLSPWAEKASEREVRSWLVLWLFTTTFPFLRKLCGHLCGAPSFGAVPFLYGECPWNGFGTFQYVSGFFGYMLLGFYFRKFVGALSWRRTLAIALPMLAAGWAIVAGGFYFRLAKYGSAFPVSAPYAAAVDLEMSWEFCSLGVVMTTMAYFMLARGISSWRMEGNALYERVVRPLSEASYGVYLVHILVLTVVIGWFKPALETPLAIPATALVVFAVSSIAVLAIRKIPLLGRWLCG